ncbi:MAG: hypothetical protein P4M12_01560 [Gammaproteobacteria bacterium]|nr:hypothetical protein [Gammaproteobacteria bacterium]
MKQPLTAEEWVVLNELTAKAGIRSPKQISSLTERQIVVGKQLKEKGFILLGKQNFTVLYSLNGKNPRKGRISKKLRRRQGLPNLGYSKSSVWNTPAPSGLIRIEPTGAFESNKRRH